MILEKIINFDSINANGTYYNTMPVMYDYNSNKYCAEWKMLEPMKNIKSMELLGFELPINFPNIRRSNNSNYIEMFVGTKQVTCTIAEKHYATITELITAINVKANSDVVAQGASFVLSINPDDPNKLILVTNTETISDSILMNTILGYNKKLDLPLPSMDDPSLYTFTFTNNYNLNYDTYLNFLIPNFPIYSINNNGTRCSFKLPLHGNLGDVVYYGNNQGYEQKLTISNNDSYILNLFQYQIFDKFGFPLYYYGGDFSITFKFVYEL